MLWPHYSQNRGTWKMENHTVYDTADNENQEFITLRWVNSEKYVYYMVSSKKTSRRHFTCLRWVSYLM